MNYLGHIFKETYRGKTIANILFTREIIQNPLDINGVFIDLGCGQNDYQKYWRIKPDKIIRVDINTKAKPDIVADLNKSLPFVDSFADVIFLSAVIYILENPTRVLKEIYRVLKPGGRLLLTSPFIFNEAREPADYYRFTSQGLERLLKESGFINHSIKPIGERFSAAVYLISPFLLFWPIKFLAYSLTIFLDNLIPRRMRLKQPCPISYFADAKK
jgi:SAM-dependent methyltransferase